MFQENDYRIFYKVNGDTAYLTDAILCENQLCDCGMVFKSKNSARDFVVHKIKSLEQREVNVQIEFIINTFYTEKCETVWIEKLMSYISTGRFRVEEENNNEVTFTLMLDSKIRHKETFLENIRDKSNEKCEVLK